MVPTVALVTLPKACAAFRIEASGSSSPSADFSGTIASSSDLRSFMSIRVSPFSSATRNATFRTPSCTSLRSSMRDNSSGPISVTVARTGWPCSPNTSQNTVENWSGWKVRPISPARFNIKSLASPTSEIPERSPLMSAANTGTPARAKPSAITCSDTVLPVPVAPVTRPCRLASASVSQAASSPLPIKIFSSVSAVLLSEVAITSPLRLHQGGLVAHRHNHIASSPSIETVGLISDVSRRPEVRASHTFFRARPRNRWRGATNEHESGVHSCIAATLATRSRTKRPWCVRTACISHRGRSRSNYKHATRYKPAEGGGHMDELIGTLAVKVGIDDAVAEKTIGIVLGFLRNEGPSDKVQALIDQIPGAEAAIAASNSNGGLSRLMGGGLMAVGTRLMALGLGMNEIKNVARELFSFGRDKIGGDQMGEIISGTPGLSQFA